MKYTQGCLVTGSEYAKQDLVLSEAKNTKCKTRTDTGSGYILQIGISNKDSGSKVQKGVKLKVASGPKSPLEVNDGKENVSVNSYGKTNKPQNPYRSTSGPYGYLTEAKEVRSFFWEIVLQNYVIYQKHTQKTSCIKRI